MSDLSKQCDACQATLVLSEDLRTLDCPQCGSRIPLRPPCPYSPNVVAEAEEHIALLEKATAGLEPEVRHALLWLLEEKLLFTPGHIVTVKVGSDPSRQPTACAICSKQPAASVPVLYLELRDRWRHSDTMINVCRHHMEENMWAGDMDVLRNQSLKLGLN